VIQIRRPAHGAKLFRCSDGQDGAPKPVLPEAVCFGQPERMSWMAARILNERKAIYK